MIAWPARLWRWITGASRQRRYRSAVDLQIDLMDARLEGIETLIDAYEERVRLMERLFDTYDVQHPGPEVEEDT